MDTNQKKKNNPRVANVSKEKNTKSKENRNRENKKCKEKKRKKFSILGFIFSILLIVIIILVFMFGYFCIKEDFDVKKAVVSMWNTITGGPEPITVLVLGVSTDISTELTDTIMVCSYNPSTENAYILSIPRDTFIGQNINSAKGRDKINSVFSREGVQGTLEKVEGILDINIDYYAIVRTEALIDIVDSIGGVNFDVPIDMDYDDVTQDLHIHLDSGMQLIDGEKAEQLLRFRHNNNGTSYPSSYGDNDFGRMRTQRDFIKATVSQTASWGNVFKINKISNAIFDNVETNVSLLKALKYIPYIVNFDVDSLETYQLPGDSKLSNSVWVYVHNSNKTKVLMDELTQNLNNN